MLSRLVNHLWTSFRNISNWKRFACSTEHREEVLYHRNSENWPEKWQLLQKSDDSREERSKQYKKTVTLREYSDNRPADQDQSQSSEKATGANMILRFDEELDSSPRPDRQGETTQEKNLHQNI